MTRRPRRSADRVPPLVTGTVAVVAAVALLTACSSGDDAPAAATTTMAPATTPPTTAPPVATTEAAVGAGQPFTVWLLRDGRLSPGQVRIAQGPDGPREALDALLAGRTPLEEDLGLQTGLSTYVQVQSWEQQGGTVVVGFNRAFETAQTRPQVAQVVWTLTQFPGIDAVQLLIDGLPNGATGVPPMDRFEVDEVAPPVLVDAPLPGSALPGPASPLVVTGTTAPGAVVGWRLEAPDGTPLATGGADEVAEAPGPDARTAWRTTVALPTGLAGDVRLVAFDTSTGAEVYPQVIPLTLTP